MALTPKQQRFVKEYLIDLNGTQAAIRAGYKPSNAESTACALLKDPKVSQGVADGQAQQLERLDHSANEVLEELFRVGLGNIANLLDAKGELKPIKDMPPAHQAMLSSVEWVMKNATAGDGKIDRVLKIRLWDKVRALETLARHYRLLTDTKVDEDAADWDKRVARLQAARGRAKKQAGKS